MERGEFAGTRRIWKTSRQLLLEENFGGVTSVSVPGSSRLMSLDRRHLWNHIRNASVKRQFRAAPFFFFFECEKGAIGRRDTEGRGNSFPSFLLLANTWQAASTKLEEWNTIANYRFLFFSWNDKELGCVILYFNIEVKDWLFHVCYNRCKMKNVYLSRK